MPEMVNKNIIKQEKTFLSKKGRNLASKVEKSDSEKMAPQPRSKFREAEDLGYVHNPHHKSNADGRFHVSK